jgi:hypothetical protein
VALVLLDRAVPASIATPIPAITSIHDEGYSKNTAHLALSAEKGFAKTPGWVAGWGVADECGISRNIGTMMFEQGSLNGREHFYWAQGCVSVRSCSGDFMPTDGACPSSWDKRADFIKMHRTQSRPGVFDGPMIASGDSGGALSIFRLRGGLIRQYLLGVISQGQGGAQCGERLEDYDLVAGMAPTFGEGVGSFIESQLHTWVDTEIRPIKPPRPHIPFIDLLR